MRASGWNAATALLFVLAACGAALFFRRLDQRLRGLSWAYAALAVSGLLMASGYWVESEVVRVNLARASFLAGLGGLLLVIIHAVRPR